MKLLAAGAALALTAFLGSALPASAARDGYVIDNAHLFSASAISAVNTKISNLKAQTGKEIVIDTESSLDGQTAPAAAEKVFSAQQVNGVLIFVAKPAIGVVPDTASKRWFTKSTTSSIASSIRGYFKSGDYDGGLNAGVDSAISIYQQHLSALNQPTQHRYVQQQPVTTHQDVGGGFNLNWIWLLVILFVVFMIIRAIFRAMSGPRNYGGPGYGPGPGGPGFGGGPGYGGGYGPGYGGGGGGGFFSGLLGGLGGAFIGNELFGGNRGGETIINENGGGVDQAGMAAGGGQDASGWQSDPGQADMSNASFTDYSGGDSGGGGGWGGGDSGGGDSGGGDSSGGGW
jgi:uncharacterized protein